MELSAFEEELALALQRPYEWYMKRDKWLTHRKTGVCLLATPSSDYSNPVGTVAVYNKEVQEVTRVAREEVWPCVTAVRKREEDELDSEQDRKLKHFLRKFKGFGR